jgi:hypothetical protein
MKNALIALLLWMAYVSANDTITHKATNRTFNVENIDGWKIIVNKDIKKDKAWPLAKRIISNQLFSLKRKLNDSVIHAMQKVPIYVDIEQKGKSGAEYHPSKKWLQNNGFSPLKAECIEISGISGFIRYTESQPWVLLHELMHAYHHQVLKFDHKEIIASYKEIMKTNKYKKTLYINGRTRDHYSRTNFKEYFSEAAEAYFGVNDYFPFTKAEILAYDPRICKFLATLKRK